MKKARLLTSAVGVAPLALAAGTVAAIPAAAATATTTRATCTPSNKTWFQHFTPDQLVVAEPG
jgi:hypothetical protein